MPEMFQLVSCTSVRRVILALHTQELCTAVNVTSEIMQSGHDPETPGLKLARLRDLLAYICCSQAGLPQPLTTCHDGCNTHAQQTMICRRGCSCAPSHHAQARQDVTSGNMHGSGGMRGTSEVCYHGPQARKAQDSSCLRSSHPLARPHLPAQLMCVDSRLHLYHKKKEGMHSQLMLANCFALSLLCCIMRCKMGQDVKHQAFSGELFLGYCTRSQQSMVRVGCQDRALRCREGESLVQVDQIRSVFGVGWTLRC